VRAFYNKAKTMPPPNPGSLPDDTYADIVAYVLDINGFESGGRRISGRQRSTRLR
jgi:hypothetical protein